MHIRSLANSFTFFHPVAPILPAKSAGKPPLNAWKTVHREMLLRGICCEAALESAEKVAQWGGCRAAELTGGKGHPWVSHVLPDICARPEQAEKGTLKAFFFVQSSLEPSADSTHYVI